MPQPTPFHSRTFKLCKSQEWRNWSGYLSAVTYEPSHEFEYYAIRNAAALIDVTPLYKYEITGPDAARLMDRIITRDISKCRVGQVIYTPWCDEQGRMLDDGTVQRLAEDRFRVTAAQPNFRWFSDCAYGMNVSISEISERIAALALQGPQSRKILQHVTTRGDVETLRFFHLIEGEIDGMPAIISRTGYTGDLGYEIWIDYHHAEQLWDVLMEGGRGFGIHPTGLAALDIARIEAGLILTDVDYVSSYKALIDSRMSTPFEAGLDWAVHLRKRRFVGQRALIEEKKRGSRWRLCGLAADWEAIEALYAAVDLAPQMAGRASRVGVPVYRGGKQVGQATSSTFSPLLKKYIALATLQSKMAIPGTRVDLEFTVEFVRHRVPATVVKLPFFNPERKRAGVKTAAEE